MSFIGIKGGSMESIFSSLKKFENIKIIENRCGSKQLDDLIEKFIPVLIRYSEERGIKFCLDHDIMELTHDGGTPKEILFEKEWKNESMLEDLLDFLTWRGFFKKKGREYHSLFSLKRQNQLVEEKRKISTRIMATLNDISPFDSSRKPRQQTIESFGLQQEEKSWIEEKNEFRVVFNLLDRISPQTILEAMKQGRTTLDNQPAQFGPLMDSFFMNPSFLVPRMTVIATAFKHVVPNKIMSLNCGTGRCVEEFLIFNPHLEIAGVTDNMFYLRVAERNLDVFSDQQKVTPRIEWRGVDYSQSLSGQLEDLLGQFDIILVNQLFQYYPHEMHQQLVEELLLFLKPDRVIAFFQHLRENDNLPWPHEWLYRAIQGFSGIPAEGSFKELFKNNKNKNIREVIPLSAYLFV